MRLVQGKRSYGSVNKLSHQYSRIKTLRGNAFTINHELFDANAYKNVYFSSKMMISSKNDESDQGYTNLYNNLATKKEFYELTLQLK